MQSKKNIIFIVLILFLLSNCGTEKKLINGFKTQNKNSSILITKPEFIFKTNEYIKNNYPSFDKQSDEIKDTIWKYNTIFLDSLDETRIFDTFYTNLTKIFKKNDISVYTSNDSIAFEQDKNKAYKLKIAQFQIEENRRNIEYVKEIDSTNEIYKSFILNTLSINIWLELYDIKNDTANPVVLFLENKLSDFVNGEFINETPEDSVANYKFNYYLENISNNEIENLPIEAALECAQQLTDYLFNIYVKKELPETSLYYGYDLRTKKLYYPLPTKQIYKIKN